MRYRIPGGRGRVVSVLLPLVLFVLTVMLPRAIPASESCAMMGGTCRGACGGSEQSEPGAFEDCGPREECCVARAGTPARCCILSFEAKDFGPSNCRPAEGGACPKGSASPVPCEKLSMCAGKN